MGVEKEKEQPQNDPLESLEPIRQSVRRICSQDQFTWEQSWKSVLSDVNQVRRGLLLPDVFQQTLELNEIRLTKKAFQELIEQFQLPNGAVQAHKFLQWIDLSRPSDHIDPELAFARLPQPYRRIVKVLEQDILDSAWEKIKATSAKFKAETSAALSARSARASLLSLQANDDAGGCLDDYDLAKKRCCKTFKELPMPTPDAHHFAMMMMKKHWRLPFLVVVWKNESEDAADRVLLQLVDTQTQKTLISLSVVVPSPSSAATVANDSSLVDLVGMSQLCCPEDESTSNDTILLVALHVRMTHKAIEGSVETAPPPAVSSVVVYEFTIPSQRNRERLPVAHSVSSTKYEDPSVVSVTALEISNDASHLAVSTTKGETLVYALPPPLQEMSLEHSETTLPPQQPLLLATMVTESPVAAVYFLATPATDFHPQKHTKPYAIAVVVGQKLSKFLLPTANIATSAPLHASWSHLSPITSSSIDPSSQYLTVGLEDGLVVVWNVLEDRDHVMLSPIKAGAAIDRVIFYGSRFVIALSQQSQQLFFYDVSHRAVPRLVRVVTPPPIPPQQQQESGSAVDPTRIVGVSPQTTWLDVPVVVVEYSNGYCMLYDAHNGEAMTSFRIPKTGTLSSRPQLTAVGHDSIVGALPCAGPDASCRLGAFDWGDLLKTAFPTLEAALVSKGLEKTTANLKRLFLASSEGSRDGLTVSLGVKASLHSLLLASAGHHSSKSSVLSGYHQQQDLGESKSSSTLTRASNSDSRASLASTGSVGGGGSQSHQQLPELPHIATNPSVPSFSARFSQYCEEEKLLVPRSDQDTRLQRRRNELIKILTAAW